MHRFLVRLFQSVSLLLLLAMPVMAAGPGTSFTYQGRLNDGGAPANGVYDLQFSLFGVASVGNAVSGPLDARDVRVTNGLFIVNLDFGAAFDGNPRWLEISVRTNGVGPFTALHPRQPITPAPYAMFAGQAATAATASVASSVAANAVSAAGLQNATITGAKIASGQVVRSLNGLTDGVTLVAGTNVKLTTNANTLTVASTSPSEGTVWNLTGNAGTKPTVNFLGTTDGKPLVIKAGNVGVGVTNPQAALEVKGTVKATQFTGEGSGLTGVQAASLATTFTLTNLARLQVAAYASGVAVIDHYALVANGYDGLRVFDVADPTRPAPVARLGDLAADAWTVRLLGSTDYAYVGTSDGVIRVDIHDPLQPFINARLTTPAGVRSIALGITQVRPASLASDLQGSPGQNARLAAGPRERLFLANDTEGLRTCVLHAEIDPLTQESIVTLQTLSVIYDGGRAWGVATTGDIVFLANEADGLRTYNLADPSKPVRLGHVKSLDRAFGVVVAPGNLVYVAGGTDGVLIYNVSNPATPVLTYTIPGADARNVTISGRLAFVAWNHEGIRAYDISEPRHPVELGRAPIVGDGFALDVAVAGNYVYTANEIGGLYTYLAAPLATVPGLVLATGFAGDGSALTGIRASQLAGDLPGSISENLWKLGGNAGVSAGRFLGTTDPQPLDLRANGASALRLDARVKDAPNLIGGSAFNQVPSGVLGSTVAGGGNQSSPNQIAANYAAIGGGLANTIHPAAMGSTISGGSVNTIGSSATAATVGGGGRNEAAASYATVPGGLENEASGAYSLAAGHRAKARHEGSFVWADSAGLDFASTANDQFLIRATGGVGIGGPPQAATLDVEGPVRVNENDLWFRSGSDTNHGVGWYGASRPFGQFQPDGPVLYGYAGGVLATTKAGPLARLTWDQDGVKVFNQLTTLGKLSVLGETDILGKTEVLGDVTVSGDLSAANTAGVNWDQVRATGGAFKLTGNQEFEVASCSNARPAPGFFVIFASVWTSVEVGFESVHLSLRLVDRTGGGEPTTLTYRVTRAGGGNLSKYWYPTSLDLAWVVPIEQAGPAQTFALRAKSDGGNADLFDRNLTVVYFPRRN